MRTRAMRILLISYGLLTLAAFALAIGVLVTYTPTEETMGQIQKVFYLHLPVAIATFIACLVSFIASVGYLVQRRSIWDDLASASAAVAVQFCTVVLITGMLWGRGAWGRWWTWSPRLTFSLILWLLYVVYLVVRMSIESRSRRALISSVYGVIAFLDVPLVYLSVRLMPDIHPSSIDLAWPMKLTLVAWILPVFLLLAWMIITKFQINRRSSILISDEAANTQTPGPVQPRWVRGAS